MAGPLVLLPLLPLAASGSSASSSQASRASAAADSAAPTVNWALSGQASADSSESGNPASNAIDGDAGTDWCTSAWTGSLIVDLGQVRSLSDLGITLDATSPSAERHHPGREPVRRLAARAGGQQRRAGSGQPDVRAAAAGHPGAVRAAHRLERHRRRRVRRGVPDVRPRSGRGRHGASARTCPSPRRNSPPEPSSPTTASSRARCTIMRENGANYVRMRLWVNPPPGLQQPGQRPGPGPQRARGRDEDLPGHHVLRLLGRPAAPGHPGRLAGPGPRPAHRDRAVLHPAGDLGVRQAGHAGGHGLHRQRDPQRHPVAGRAGERPVQPGGLRQPGHAAQGGRGRGPGREPAAATSC